MAAIDWAVYALAGQDLPSRHGGGADLTQVDRSEREIERSQWS